jgi:hypothetical protein
MDPFIEACGLWGDFHDELIGEIKREVSRRLPSRYVARMCDRTYVEWIDPSDLEPVTRPFEPDVAIRRSGRAVRERSGGVAVAEADPQAVVMHALLEIEHHEIFLEIRELDPQRRLVTCIEVLSPSNKRFGSAGWLQYDRKRQVFLEGHANLVEIDLLRGGRRRGMDERWPDSPYYVLAMRKHAAPECQVWPAHTTQPLPEVAVPLEPPDADLRLPLQSLVEAIYARSRYEVDIDYSLPLEPPLRPDESAFLPRTPSLGSPGQPEHRSLSDVT